MDIDDDDIGNIKLFNNHPVGDVVVGKPISEEWRPIPPIGKRYHFFCLKMSNFKLFLLLIVNEKLRPEIGEKLLKQVERVSQ